jgi:hypothetical protein
MAQLELEALGSYVGGFFFLYLSRQVESGTNDIKRDIQTKYSFLGQILFYFFPKIFFFVCISSYFMGWSCWL